MDVMPDTLEFVIFLRELCLSHDVLHYAPLGENYIRTRSE